MHARPPEAPFRFPDTESLTEPVSGRGQWPNEWLFDIMPAASNLSRRALPTLSFLAAVAASLSAASVAVRFNTTPRDIVVDRVSTATVKNRNRADVLRRMFTDAGCPAQDLELQRVERVAEPNVVCTIRGETTSEIIVGAHTDHAEKGLGVIDDWSGAALLPSLAESIKTIPRHHTYVFAGFTAEEAGLLGSHSYVGHLGSEGLRRTAAMIDLDSIGAGPPEVQTITADPMLLQDLLRAASSVGMHVRLVNFNEVGTSDFDAFRSRGVPTLIVHSLTPENWRLLHTRKDNLSALSVEDYYNTYRLMALYITLLDDVLDTSEHARYDPRAVPPTLRGKGSR